GKWEMRDAAAKRLCVMRRDARSVVGFEVIALDVRAQKLGRLLAVARTQRLRDLAMLGTQPCRGLRPVLQSLRSTQRVIGDGGAQPVHQRADQGISGCA